MNKRYVVDYGYLEDRYHVRDNEMGGLIVATFYSDYWATEWAARQNDRLEGSQQTEKSE